MDSYSLSLHLNGGSRAAIVREELRLGLTAHPMTLSPKYFYDSHGTALFQRITELPEYYLTRVEQSLIECFADELMDQVRPLEVVELGPGSSAKVRPLLGTRTDSGLPERYVPFDINRETVQVAVKSLVEAYPHLQAHGVVGDFERDLGSLPPPIGRRLVAFFGSTIGNLDPPSRHGFLAQIRRMLASGDRLLLGVDLVKDPAVLEAAYNDSAGVTVEFNRNILRVVNRAVHADFRPEAFQHHAFYNEQASRIEMHLSPGTRQTVYLRDLALDIEVPPGDNIWTESSYKFTQESTLTMLAQAGMRLERWYTDGDGLFALALAARA